MNQRRQLRARNIRLFINKSLQQTNGPRLLDTLRDWIGIATAGAGLFAAFLYLAGRNFANSYFSAMNIPNYHVNFSLWEYGEVAWFPLFLYPIIMIFLSGLLGGIFSAISDWTSPVWVKFSNWIKKKLGFRFPNVNLPKQSRETKLWFAITGKAFSALLLISTTLLTLHVVSQYGKLNGQLAVLGGAPQIEMISLIPLDASNSALNGSNGQNNHYKDFRLLTFNNDRYYLFKEIDPATCKPVQVYVIDSVNLAQVSINQAGPLDKTCYDQLPKGLTSTMLFLFTK